MIRPEGLQRFEIGSKIGKGFYREYPSGAFPPAASGSGQGGIFLKFFEKLTEIINSNPQKMWIFRGTLSPPD